MEAEVESLRQRVEQLERLVKGEGDGGDGSLQPSQCGAQGPTLRPMPEYDQVEGWKLVDLMALNEALEAAQLCGHNRLVLVEADRKVSREGLSAIVGFVCRQCGAQTLLPTSKFSRTSPTGFQVNKEFSAALGHRAYSKLVTLVQGDSSIRKVEGARGSPRLMTRFSEDQQEEVVLEGAVVKEELVDDDIPYMEDNYLEPTVCLTEPEEVSGGFGSVDPSTVTTNTPTLALATVPPDTPILGGRVTPHPTDRMIAVHPSQFIRTTCSKVFLPPGIYKYARNNGLNSIMSVRADTGSFDALEAHYLITSARGVTRRRSLVEEPVVQQPNGFQQQPIDALQLFTADLQKQLGQKECKKGDFNAVVETKWAELSYDEKRAYYDRATAAASPIEGASAKPKKTTNIPLPALKRFAATIASGLKEKQPHLAELQHRGQLNKIILKRWMALPEDEKEKFREGVSSKPTTPTASRKVSPKKENHSPKKENPSQKKENNSPKKENHSPKKEQRSPKKDASGGKKEDIVTTKRIRIPKKIMDS